MIEIPKLRFYQEDLKEKLLSSISNGHKGICAVSPCGSGKSKLQGRMIVDFVNNGKQCIIVVHRQELVKQLSVMLGEYRQHHNIIAPKSVIGEAKRDHLMTLGKCYIDPFASGVYVCAVQTLAKNMHKLKLKPDFIFGDEFHHWTEGTYWGRVVEYYRNAILLGFTASPEMLSGKGLGVGHGGYCTDLVIGPYVDDLIEGRFLSEYVAFVPPEPINVRCMRETASGQMSRKDQQEFMSTKNDRVMADALRHYQEHCPGQPMVVYCATVKASELMAEQFAEAGFKSCAVNGKTPDAERARSIRGLGTGETEVLCNAEILGEGVDVPALTAVALCRPTQSLALHIQQTGRPLRPHPSKPLAYIFDCVGNIQNLNHFPCTRREWSLEGKKGRKREGDKITLKTRTCPSCFATHHMSPTCPCCGHVYTVAEMELQRIEMELRAISPEELKSMREQQRQEQIQEVRKEQNAAIRQGLSAAEMVAIDLKNGLKPGATSHKMKAIEEKKQAKATYSKAMKYWKETCLWGDYQLHDRLFAEVFGVTEEDARKYGTVRINRLVDRMRQYVQAMPSRNPSEYSPYTFDFVALKNELWSKENEC